MDTSSFVKLFLMETGSPAMIAFSQAERDEQKIVSALTQVEARSAIVRLQRSRTITADEATLARSSLDYDLKLILVQPVDGPVLQYANALVERHLLRALDAIQLASAFVARDSLLAAQIRFIASDHDLLKAARAEGFVIWNPAA